MLTLDRSARRIRRRAAAQVGQLWLAATYGPELRQYNKRLDGSRAPLWWTRIWSRTIVNIGRVRLQDWRSRHAV